jgi:GNAT superfamily N-acetyltransferase
MQAPACAGLVVARATEDVQLEHLVRIRNGVDPEAHPTVANLRHHLDTEPDLVYLVATLDGVPAGCGFAGSHPGDEGAPYLTADVSVLPSLRRRGVGTALYHEVSTHARSLGKQGLTLQTKEDDPDSVAWLERRGFSEVERQNAVALSLEEARPLHNPPAGVEVVSRADRPGLEKGMYPVAVEAGRDIPGLDGEHDPSFEQWRSFEIDRPSRRADLSFVALAGDEVIGFASLDVFGNRDTAYHGLTAVARHWRGRGVATAMKSAQIQAARAAGLRRLVTENEERNAPMRAVNAKLGYAPIPGVIVFQGPLALES